MILEPGIEVWLDKKRWESVLAQVAITKYHRWGGVRKRRLLLTVVEAESSEVKAQHGE